MFAVQIVNKVKEGENDRKRISTPKRLRKGKTIFQSFAANGYFLFNSLWTFFWELVSNFNYFVIHQNINEVIKPAIAPPIVPNNAIFQS